MSVLFVLQPGESRDREERRKTGAKNSSNKNFRGVNIGEHPSNNLVAVYSGTEI